jgi:ATP-dependent DNA ligase
MIIYRLPILYILTNNKKRFWEIWLSEEYNNIYICRKYGILGGKITVPNKKLIENKKKAETQINALWRKKKESGFQEESNIIQMKSNIVKPMGAHKLDDYYHKIKYPAYVQRKLDGFRCLSNIKNNKVILYSKGMKEFVYLNHIKKEILKIKELLNNENIYLDGELYKFCLGLHDISSLVMKKYASKSDEELMKQISYNIFDIFNITNLNESFEQRYKNLKKIFKYNNFKYLKLVTCENVNYYEEIKNLDIQYLYEGYEGVIVRNKDGIYKLNSKSYDVLRTKEFKKKEFEIIGAKMGSGTQNGAIIWQLKCNNKSFWAIPIGTIKDRIQKYKEFINFPNRFIGKFAKVKYLVMDSDGCITRNPIVEEVV